MNPSPKRCAVYTRKSTEAGLEQKFNSLHAQREACLAYVKSQKHEGWTAISAQYDDGGFSGGSMDRPALKKLLEDVESGEVDTIVVYKVDRLTRSLTDFSKIIDLLDRHGASFVSVTQQFNTTSSMRRLTLNVLLSFAQFEREVTSERIRDKIAASKEKGLWMGGVPPLGYDVADRQLVVNPAEAETIRKVFSTYLEVSSVKALRVCLDKMGLKTKSWTSRSGRRVPGSEFTRGRLHHLLKNPIYIGRIVHKDKLHEGRHEAIVPLELWTLVQQRLKDQWGERKTAKNQKSPCWIVGQLYDGEGRAFKSSQTTKNGRRYYYYTAGDTAGDTDGAPSSWRLPAKDIEKIVVSGLTEAICNPHRLIEMLAGDLADASTLKHIQQAAQRFSAHRGTKTDLISILKPVIECITVDQHRLEFALNKLRLCEALGIPPQTSPMNGSHKKCPAKITTPVQLKRRGVETRLILHSEKQLPTNYNEKLARLVAKAHVWFEQIKSGERKSVDEIASAEKIDTSNVSRALPLAFLAPSIVEDMLEGRQPIRLTAERLRRTNDLPSD